MAIKAGDWTTLWQRMGTKAPCRDWRHYIETFPNVSAAMRGIRSREARGEAPGITARFAPGFGDNDALAARHWLWGLLGGAEVEVYDLPPGLPSTRKVLDALACYEDPS